MVSVAAGVIVALLTMGAKFWGVILMALAIVVLFFMPWLDRSPVLSIRYRSAPFKIALAIFIVAFVILGYLGMNSPTPGKTLLAQICTVIYFAFFLLMPWYTQMGKTKEVPERVTFDAH